MFYMDNPASREETSGAAMHLDVKNYSIIVRTLLVDCRRKDYVQKIRNASLSIIPHVTPIKILVGNYFPPIDFELIREKRARECFIDGEDRAMINCWYQAYRHGVEPLWLPFPYSTTGEAA